MAQDKEKPRLILVLGGQTGIYKESDKAYEERVVEDKKLFIAKSVLNVIDSDLERRDIELLANILKLTLLEAKAEIRIDNDYLVLLEKMFEEEYLITNGEDHSVEYLLYSKICEEAKKRGLSTGEIFIKMRQFGAGNVDSSYTREILDAAKFLNKDRFVPNVLTFTFEKDPYYYMTLCKTDEAIDARFSSMLRRFA